MLSFPLTFFALASVLSASAKQIVITVGKNTTDNATAVFDPAEVFAKIGDTVLFNFTEGNHSAIQSSFGQPCLPLHESDPSINSFDSGPRDTVNGTAITTLLVPIDSNDTIWFFDYNLCPEGGVGGININDSSTATLDGFVRNAMRLNGTDSETSTSSSPRVTTTSPSSSRANGTVAGDSSNHAGRNIVLGLAAGLPMAAAALLL